MEDWREQLLSISERIGKMMLSVNKALSEFVQSDAFNTMLELFRNIPDDIQDTELFHHIAGFEKAEITYDDVEWLQEHLGYRTYESSVNILKEKAEKTELDNYIYSILDTNAMSEREKLIVLLAHFEALVYQAMTYERKAKDTIKTVISQKSKNVHAMKIENYGTVLIAGIVFIVFSNTDKYVNDIDRRIPFRNNILHRGMINYSDDEARSAYELLVYFISEFVTITE